MITCNSKKISFVHMEFEEKVLDGIINKARLYCFSRYNSSLDSNLLENLFWDSIADIYLGVRKWPPRLRSEDGLVQFIGMVVRSKVLNYKRKYKNHFSLTGNIVLPKVCEKASQIESAVDNSKLKKVIQERLINDPMGIQVCSFIISCELYVPKPKEIALSLGLKKHEVRNTIRRLKRKLKDLKHFI